MSSLWQLYQTYFITAEALLGILGYTYHRPQAQWCQQQTSDLSNSTVLHFSKALYNTTNTVLYCTRHQDLRYSLHCLKIQISHLKGHFHK